MQSALVEQIYRQYGKEIYNYLLSLSKNPTLAEDLTQEAFVKAILSLPDAHANARAWLYTVARNLCMDHFRRSARRADRESPEDRRDDAPATEEIVFREMQNQTLARALLRLDARKRELVSLQYFSGLSVKEIAGLTHMSAENVRVLVCRAKKELKAYLEEQGYDVP